MRIKVLYPACNSAPESSTISAAERHLWRREESPPEVPMARRTVLLLIGLFGPGAAVPPAMTAPSAARADLLGDPLPDGALARVGTLRFRHGATIVSVAYAPDGKSVATGGRDGV